MPTLIDGKYEVLSKIKEGGMGAIFLVRHVRLDSIRVIKSMRPAIEDDADARKRFLREARMATDLRHPGIAAALDFLEDEDHTFYLVMEYIEGPSLAELISSHGRLPLDAALDIAQQTLNALGYLHRKGIVHRDISPENIMLTEESDGRISVKLIDLGVAKHTTGSDMTQTGTGIFVGKLQYGSPEQLGMLKRGETIDGRTDIYSLGCVLYLAVTGQPPMLSESAQGYISQHLVKGPRAFEETDPDGHVVPSVRKAILKALARNRNDRWLSAEEFEQALGQERRDFAQSLETMDPDAAGRLRRESTRVLAAVHDGVEKRKATAVLGPREIYEEATIHVEPPPSSSGQQKLVRPTMGTQPTVRTPMPARPTAVGRPAPGSAPPVTQQRAVELKTGNDPRLKAHESVLTGVRKPSRAVVIAGSAFLTLALGAGVILLKSRSSSTTGPSGTLILTATPWARVVSIVDEKTRANVAAGEVLTPARIALPPGRYELTLRGDPASAQADLAVTAEVRAGEESPVHVRVPGFDLEKAVRTYVP